MTKDKTISKLNPDIAPDMITGSWYKQLKFYRPDLTALYYLALVDDQVLSTYLATV